MSAKSSQNSHSLACRRWITHGRSQRVALTAITGLVGLIGLLVIAGWFLESRRIVQISSDFAPMQFNAAVLFVFVSVGTILGIRLRKWPAIGCGIGVIAFSAMTLAQYFLKRDLGLDSLFLEPFLTGQTSHPGRMAPNTAVCFLLGGIAVIGLASGEKGLRLNSMAGSLILAVSVLSLYGYVTETEKAYGWGDQTRMALHSSVGFFLLALILMAEGWRRFRIVSDHKKVPGWLPCTCAVLAFTLGLCAWNSIVIMEEKSISDETVVRANLIHEKFGLGLEGNVKALIRMADRFDVGMRGDKWVGDAKNYIEDVPGLYAIAIVTDTLVKKRMLVAGDVKWKAVNRFPLEKFTAHEGQDVVIFTDESWIAGNFAIFVKLDEALLEGEHGYIAALFDGEAFLEAAVGNSDEQYRYLVVDGDGSTVAGSGEEEKGAGEPIELPLMTYGEAWKMTVYPRVASVVTNVGMRLSTLTLLVAFFISVLVFLLVRLALRNFHAGLDRSDEELRIANTELETMLYIVSHDLREPVRSITSFSSILEEEYCESLDEKGRDLLMRIVRSGDRMETLLRDVVTVSRADRLDKAAAKIDLGEMVAEQVTSLTDRIEEKKAEVTVSGAFPIVCGDRMWIGQAILNLVSNAVKFSDADKAPEISIEPYSGEEGVGIVVRDRGCGLPENADERLFELFRRGVGRKVAGTGVGLAIVRRVARKHGGESWFRNRTGGGSEFFVTFGKVAV